MYITSPSVLNTSTLISDRISVPKFIKAFSETGFGKTEARKVLSVISFILKTAFCKLVKIDLYKEIFEENNKGAALGQIALYIGVANIIVNFLLGLSKLFIYFY